MIARISGNEKRRGQHYQAAVDDSAHRQGLLEHIVMESYGQVGTFDGLYIAEIRMQMAEVRLYRNRISRSRNPIALALGVATVSIVVGYGGGVPAFFRIGFRSWYGVDMQND